MGAHRHAALAAALAFLALAACPSALAQPAVVPASSSPLASPAEAAELLTAESSAAAKAAAAEDELTTKASGAASLFGNVYVGDVSHARGGELSARKAAGHARKGRVHAEKKKEKKKEKKLASFSRSPSTSTHPSSPPPRGPWCLPPLLPPPSQATYYGDAGASGSCAFNYAGVQNEAWARGTAYRVAMNAPQFFGSEVCGLCLKFRGLGPGAGANPVGQAIRYVLVSNQCPECRGGDLDLEKAGDGRWRAGWTPVQCAVAATPFVYSFQGSHQWFLKLQVANTRVPVRTAHWYARGQWWPMGRTTDNYFRLQSPDGVAWTFPARVRLVSIFGDVVYDTVAMSKPVGRVTGKVQFPGRSNLETVPLGGKASDDGDGGGDAFAAAASAGRPDEGAAPIPGGRSGEGLPTGLGYTLTSARAAAVAAEAAAAAAEAVVGDALWPHGLNAWPPGWGGVGGGVGGNNGSAPPPQLGAPPPDQPPPTPPTTVATHPPWEAGWWPGPAGPTFPPPPRADNDSSALLPGRLGSGPGSAPACLGGVETGEQCGGSGGFCGGGPTCADAPWPGLCCLDPGARCVRFDGLWWGCRASPFPPNSGAEDGEVGVV